MRVCVDPGHGGRDPGAVGKVPFTVQEKAFNLSLSGFLEERLRALGHQVVMTRRRDWYVALESRANFANRLGADFFVSIHANSSANPATEGIEIFHYPGSTAGRNAAQVILRSMLRSFPDHKNRGVKEANFTVLRLTRMPAVLVECEFLSNPQQLVFLADQDNQYGLADAIARGIDRLR